MLRSTVTAVRPFRIRERVARATPMCSATRLIERFPRNSRSNSPGLAGLCMVVIAVSLVIVLIVHEDRILSLEGERQPPVAIHGDRPVPLQVTFQRVPAPS